MEKVERETSMTSDLRRFARPTPGLYRRLSAPETFEGILQKIDVHTRAGPGTHNRHFISFVLDPTDAGMSRNPPEMLIHDVRIEITPEGWKKPLSASVEDLERLKALMRGFTPKNEPKEDVDPTQPVAVTYTFNPYDVGLYASSVGLIQTIYREALEDRDDALWNAFAGQEEIEGEGGGLVNVNGPFTQGVDDDGTALSPVLKILNDLIGLRFVIDAELHKTLSGRDFTVYTWTRLRAG